MSKEFEEAKQEAKQEVNDILRCFRHRVEQENADFHYAAQLETLDALFRLTGEGWRIAIISDKEILALRRPNIREVIWQAGE